MFVCSITDRGAAICPWQGNLRKRPSNPTNLRPMTLLQCHQELARPRRSGPEGRNRSVASLLNCAPSGCRGHVDRARLANHSPAPIAKPPRHSPTAPERSGLPDRWDACRERRGASRSILGQSGDRVLASGRQRRLIAHEATKERVSRSKRSWVAQDLPINYAILFFGHFVHLIKRCDGCQTSNWLYMLTPRVCVRRTKMT